MSFRTATATLILWMACVNARPSEWRGVLQTSAEFFDNFLQAPEGKPQTDTLAAKLRLRLERPISAHAGRLMAFMGADGTVYDQFDPSCGIFGGLRAVGIPHSLELSAGYYWSRPRMDVGDAFDRADGLEVKGAYSYRIASDFEFGANIRSLKETYTYTLGNNNHSAALGGTIRYRGLGHGLSPEVGVVWSRLNADDDNNDYTARDVYLKIRSLPVPSVWLSARYRYRKREYSTAQPGAGNLGREDARDQLTLNAVVRAGHRLSWSVYYSRQDADSSKPSRSFRNQMVSLGLSVYF